MDSSRSSPGLNDTRSADEVASARETELRRAFLAIQSDDMLTPQEKGQRMQELMLARSGSLRRVTRSAPGSPGASGAASPADSWLVQPNERHGRAASLSDIASSPEPLVHAAIDTAREPSEAERAAGTHASGHVGCAHYRTAAKLQAPCCGGWYACRFCHDEAEDHAMERAGVRRMMCTSCGKTQRAAGSCAACGTLMAAHFCGQCALWDDEPGKPIFHCDECGICRRGRREDYVHCAKCVGCVDAAHYGSHKCLEDSLRSACPICSEDLFATTTPVIFMPCGHAIHYLCHQEHTRSSYQCPICLKSIADVRSLFRRIDEMMAGQRMPDEYARVRSAILCNDCERRSVAPFHFVYHCCAHCRSYNTKLLRTFSDGDAEDGVASDAASEVTPHALATADILIASETTLVSETSADGAPGSPASSTADAAGGFSHLSLNGGTPM